MPTLSPHSHPTELEQPTAELDVLAEPVLDALPLLDHRTRRRTVEPGVAAAGHYLALRDGDEHRLLPIDPGIIHVGRAVSAAVRIEEPRVSRRHAIVVRYGDRVRVLDDRSANGTYVNGIRIIATDLKHGDLVRVGPVVLSYHRIR
jgi:FHA domain